MQTSTKFINRLVATELINKSRGRFFTVTFRKKDRSLRQMTCRLGVKKGINGKGMKYEPALESLKPVFDMANNDWRMINLATITALTINKQKYEVLGY